MNLNYLNTFFELVRSGSFSGAARKLFITQPAVSYQIRRLEEELKINLIDHRKKKVTTTEAGKRLYRFTAQMQIEQSNLFHEFDGLREEITGELNIAASPIPGEFILPALLGDFKEHFPAVGIQVELLESAQVIANLLDGRFNVGFGSRQPENLDLHFFKIGEHEAVIIAYPGHPFAQRKELSLSELAEEPLILRTDVSHTPESPQSLLLTAGFDVTKCRTKMVLGSYMGVIAAVEARMGIAVVSDLAVKRSVALGLVKIVKIKGVRLKRNFFCIYRESGLSSKLNREFIAYIQSRTADIQNLSGG